MVTNYSGFIPRETQPRFGLVPHLRVVSALLLRDIQTRFGGSYLGFLVSLIMPLGHIGLLLTIFIMLGRQAPIGTDVTIFLASAIVPFVVWSYTHRQLMQCFGQNRPLMSFPVVRMFDIVVARALVEIVNATLVVAVTAAVLSLLGKDLFVFDPPRLFHALWLAYALGLATGMIFGLITMLIPGFMIVGFLFIPLYWVTSGAFFIPDVLPDQVRTLLWIFPLTHIVDYGRTGLYASYASDFWSLTYLHAVIGSTILVSLIMQRVLKPIL